MEKQKLPKEVLSIQFLVLFSYSSLAVLTLLPLFLAHLGGNPREIGFLVGLFSLAAFLSRPFAGLILVSSAVLLYAGKTSLFQRIQEEV